jgi:hypothetical protein
VDDDRRQVELAELRGPVGRGDDRRELARGAVGVIAAVVGALGQVEDPLAVRRLRADYRSGLERRPDVALAVGGCAGHQHRHRLGCRAPDLGAAGRRHDRGQRQHPLRMVDRDPLADHPAERGADDVGTIDPERVE